VAAATLLATFASYHSGKPHAVLAPLCVMAVPLYDTATVVWIRLREGRSPFEADQNHFSHRLVELGMSKTQAVLTLYLTAATTGLGALALQHADVVGASIILFMILCVLLLIAILETTARRKLRR
jgi:UDP-GlcNAc:undecaprenyl-phosphate/decaprenyl-phosphate GlcNAc-1-phosphate transferase